ncbi:DUF4245 family protein [Nocardioides plantarum]|uniref:DUF4245 family protein n=1 Tax=Nocardioides plantarum TaxID=29299 RepID=A0ABV5KAA7_9ACTN|nr:DUF4245 family protein [Nocardioides plantarum]
MSEQGGRYNRSFEGLIGAIIVIVVAVLGFVVFRGLFSDPPEQEVPEVDYVMLVRGLQDIGVDVVYPADLPEGWQASKVQYDPGERPRVEINLYTDDDEFVGIRQVDDDVDDLLAEAGIEDADEGTPLTGPAAGSVADRWDSWADPDGDHAYTTTVAGDTVLVYGGVSADELADVVGRLTTDSLTTPSSSPDPSPAS